MSIFWDVINVFEVNICSVLYVIYIPLTWLDSELRIIFYPDKEPYFITQSYEGFATWQSCAVGRRVISSMGVILFVLTYGVRTADNVDCVILGNKLKI
jgi:hypothetical protein